MPTRTNSLRNKLLTLGVLVGILVGLYTLAPRDSKAQSSNCAFDAIQYCFAQGRPIDSNCECNLSACLSPPESDCTEVGQYLDTSRCICVSNPSAVGYCDNDPYALGCPRSFDPYLDKIRVAGSGQGGGSVDICSFDAFTWCMVSGGSWSSDRCACNIGNNSSLETACGTAGGTWTLDWSGYICYKPSDYAADTHCGSSNASLSSCIAQNKKWNPNICACTDN